MDEEPARGRPAKAGERMERRRTEILTEATRLFAEEGYRQADLQVLADRLGVGKGTIYRYFPTKEELFLAAVDEGVRALSESVNAAIESEIDPVKHMKQAIRTYLGFFDHNPDLVELLIIERAEFRNREKATYFLYKDRNQPKRQAYVESAMSAGIVRRMPVDRVLNVVGDCLYGAIFTNHFSNRKVPFDQQAEEIIDVLMHGIITDPGPGNEQSSRGRKAP